MMHAVPQPPPGWPTGPAQTYAALYRRARRVHFVGVGGIGMSGIAEVLLNLGFEVSGSDLRDTEITRRLARLGARVAAGHAAGHLDGADVVVVSTAIGPDNPEVRRARELRIPVIPRAEMLGELMRMKFAVAVTGTHGKTSTTSMIAVLLHHAGVDPTAVVGGRLNIFDSSARLGQSEFLVAEADESDGSFLQLFPTVAVVTNIEPEHMEHFGTLDRLLDAFTAFVHRLPFYGTAILCLDDPNVRVILPRLDRRIRSYGFRPDADIRAEKIAIEPAGSRFDVVQQGASLGTFRLAVPGRHNVQNALAAVAVGLELGLAPDAIRAALAEFQGVDRRFQLRGTRRGVRVVDDYGHHPTEIRVTLEAARATGPRRLIAVFQPHRYSRVAALGGEFATAFGGADAVFATAIYPAGEAPLPGVSGRALADAIRAGGHPDVRYEEDFHRLAGAVAELAAAGDLVVVFGAGNINQVSPLILEALGEDNGHE